MFARFRRPSPRAMPCGVLLVACVSLASNLISGCGTSGAQPAGGAVDAGFDAVVYTTVMTQGGGIPNQDAGQTDALASSSSGASGGSAEAGDDGGSSSGVLDSGASGGGDAPSDVEAGPPYVPPSCNGTEPCDLRSNTCCLANGMTGLVGTCTAGADTTCASNEATVHCISSDDCSGLSCCGDLITILGQVKSSCRPLTQGENCPYVPNTLTQIGVQLCKTDAECMNGQPCIRQTCIYGATLSMCGLQSADAGSPLQCTPAQ
jgi:hypothetical protein